MALQNFFAASTNYRRKNPAQTSGKELWSEFRMRHKGDSIQVVSCFGTENEDGSISTHVTVRGSDGRVVFDEEIRCHK